jgi:hypothetical protein
MPQTPMDLPKRFVPTPIEARFQLSGSIILLATNSQRVIEQLERVLPPLPVSTMSPPDFSWRIVSETDDDPVHHAEPFSVHTLDYNGLSFVNIGQKGFLACDRNARLGVSFVSQSLVEDEKRFSQYFLPPLISLSRESIEASL